MDCKKCGHKSPCNDKQCECASCSVQEGFHNVIHSFVLEMASVSVGQVQKTDSGYVVINPNDGRSLADESQVKRMGRDRRSWLRFIRELGLERMVLKGLRRGGTDEELSTRQFLDRISPAPKQGNVIPIVKGNKIT